MECPKCKTQMEKGYMFNFYLWKSITEVSEIKKNISKLGFGKTSEIYTFKCPKCGALEQRADDK